MRRRRSDPNPLYFTPETDRPTHLEKHLGAKWVPALPTTGVIRLPTRLVVETIDVARSGIGVVRADPRILPLDAPSSMLGSAILDALAERQVGVPTPTPHGWDVLAKKLNAAVGVPSHADLYKKARWVEVVDHDTEIEVWPMNNLGPRAGHERLSAAAIRLSSRSPTMIGEAVFEAFLRATDAPGAKPKL